MDEITVRDALKLAVVTERVGEKIYRSFAEKFADRTEIAAIFTQLAKDEVEHGAFFEKLAGDLPEAEATQSYGADSLLRATAMSEFFRKDTFQNLEAVETPEDALEKAFGLEKSTLFFYMSLRESFGSGTALDQVIAEEKRHVTQLMKIMMTQAKFRGLGDKWW